MSCRIVWGNYVIYRNNRYNQKKQDGGGRVNPCSLSPCRENNCFVLFADCAEQSLLVLKQHIARAFHALVLVVCLQQSSIFGIAFDKSLYALPLFWREIALCIVKKQGFDVCILCFLILFHNFAFNSLSFILALKRFILTFSSLICMICAISLIEKPCQSFKMRH